MIGQGRSVIGILEIGMLMGMVRCFFTCHRVGQGLGKGTGRHHILRGATEYAIATTDLDFRITYFNPLAEKLFGNKVADVIGKTVQEIYTQERVDPERFKNG